MTAVATAASRGARLRRALRTDTARAVLGLAPLLLVVTGLFGGAVVLAVTRSLGVGPFTAAGGPSLDAYRRLAAEPEVLRSLGLTSYIALVSTTLSVVLGIGAALLLRRVVRGRRTLTTLFQLNLPIPHVIGAVAILGLLGQSGLVSRIASQAGLLDAPADFPALVFDPFAVGIIAQYVWKEVPFIGIVALVMLRAAGDDLDEVARTLGASPWQRLRHVTLPVVLPGVLSAAIIVFAFTFGTFEVPLLLGRSFPAVLPVLAHQRYTDVDLAARPEAMAISVVITVLVITAVVVASLLARRSVRRAT
jgi:putative spermidine/putrescine transport system permease protein